MATMIALAIRGSSLSEESIAVSTGIRATTAWEQGATIKYGTAASRAWLLRAAPQITVDDVGDKIRHFLDCSDVQKLLKYRHSIDGEWWLEIGISASENGAFPPFPLAVATMAELSRYNINIDIDII